MIFCVEDDSSIRDLMIYTLNASGFEAVGFSDGQSFLEALAVKKPELVMLDIMLPGEDGISVLKKLRSHRDTKDIPVIMATAKGTEYDKVIGLDLGADDYMAKPFGMMEMVSRIKAVLRRCAPKEAVQELKIGELEINVGEHTVTAAGERVQLTLKEYELLKMFMENPGHVYTRDQLLSIVWGMEYVGETRTVDVHIGTLRTKLGSCGEYISTVRGVGYRMEVKE
ncbi:MAG: response regulator transcription factor [Lachnospiraceae bacterium]|nr:response regulator transcription factor [Lachnospiraceae bacterium]